MTNQSLPNLRKPSSLDPALVARLVGVALVCWSLAGARAAAQATGTGTEDFAFVAAGDMRGFVGPAPAGKRYFDGVCEALKAVGPGAFMLSPGDCSPPGPIRRTIDRYLGTNYLWYPVAGNHDAAKAEDMAWFRHWAEAGIPHMVRRGPPGAEDSTYSFDYGNSHFVALNEYYDGRSDATSKGDVPEAALAWLKDDLAATRQPLIWVFGHKPIQSLPDMDNGKVGHKGESVTMNAGRLDRFIQLLKQYHVRAYICGHTHKTSVAKVKGIWQADSGHSRGGGDKTTPSTFLKFRVSGSRAWVDIYRADANGEHYQLRKTVELD
jgi:predicted phosphodiesterase